MSDQQRRHPWLVGPDTDSIARDPGLTHFEHRGSDAISIADADLVVGEALDREVLTELSIAEIVAVKELAPVPVRLDLVDEHSPVDATMPLHVALAVTVHIESSNHTTIDDGILPNPSADKSPLPLDVTRLTNVHRQQPTRRVFSH
jgi:hypothetical protein